VNERPAALHAWHEVVRSKNLALLDDLLADECEFRSPAVFAPQRGKQLTGAYLGAALLVLGPTLRYVHEWSDGSSAVLEFEADLDGTYVQGVDMLRWDSDDRLVAFTVLVRPLRGLEKLIESMRAALERA
jgi:hypothetical protein